MQANNQCIDIFIYEPIKNGGKRHFGYLLYHVSYILYRPKNSA